MHNTPRRMLNRTRRRTSIQAIAVRHGQVAVILFQLQLLSATLVHDSAGPSSKSTNYPRVHLTHVVVLMRCRAVALSDPTLTTSALGERATL